MKCLVLATTIACGVIIAPAEAQNSFHAPSDLVLTFQNPGGLVGSSQTVTVALGNVSTMFRDAVDGSVFSPNAANITNLGTVLQSTFGDTANGVFWYDQPSLWMGAIGFRGTSPTATQLLDLDPQQTIYFTKLREGVGTVGFANSPTPTTIANSGSGITSAMQQVKEQIEQFGTAAVFVQGTGTSFIDDQNPFTGGNPAFGQSTAYAFIGGGVQDNFAAGPYGVFGTAGSVEMALDLYRIQNRNDITPPNGTGTQYGLGQPIGQGEYLGTITLNQAGQVAFSANVPEPSAAVLLGVATLGLISRRRRCHA